MPLLSYWPITLNSSKNLLNVKIPLTLSGHTHGGQIVFMGMPLVPTGTPYTKGRYVEEQSVCYVNNGTGHWFPIRINCPREITVITFFDGVA